jgi:hypothetical protein
VDSRNVYKVGNNNNKIVIVQNLVTADERRLTVHNLKLFRNGKLDSVVFKVFLDSAEITGEIAKTSSYAVPLIGGKSLVFVSGNYEEGGKPLSVTRVLPEIYSTDVRRGPDGALLISESLAGDDNRTLVRVEKRYSIGRDGQLESVVTAVFRGSTDITDEVARTPNYQVWLWEGYSLVFVSATVERDGKRLPVTRVLPRLYSSQVRREADGGLLVSNWYRGIEGETITVERRYSIDQNGELRDAVQSVKQGPTDMTPAILSGQCMAIGTEQGNLSFNVVHASNGPPIISVTGE